MKSIFAKLVLLGIVLFPLLQAFTPPLPDYTSIKVTGLSYYDSQNVKHGYYAAKVVATGYLLSDNTQGHQSEIIISSPRENAEYFGTDFQAYYSGNMGPLTGATVYVKQNSNSSWVCLGHASTFDSFVTPYYNGNYLYMMEFGVIDLEAEAPIED